LSTVVPTHAKKRRNETIISQVKSKRTPPVPHGTEEAKPNTTTHQQHKDTKTQNKQIELKPAFHDLWPGNETGLFL